MKLVPLRKLKAQMIIKGLSLGDVARLARVPYTTASSILNGQLVHPEYRRQLENAVRQAPTPQEAGV
jgi:hypothetical protein